MGGKGYISQGLGGPFPLPGRQVCQHHPARPPEIGPVRSDPPGGAVLFQDGASSYTTNHPGTME